MKKLLFTMVAALVSTAMTFAQSSVLATLSHDGEISTFYGATALKLAHSVAQDGDVITLSSGSFQAVDITKALTIRGAGMQVDSIAKIYPTVVVGSFTINIADTLEQHLTVEGVYFDNNTVTVKNRLKNATFIKSRFYTFKSLNSYGGSTGMGNMVNLAFIHCKIANSFDNTNESNSISFVNSVIRDPVVGSSTYTNNCFEFTNCVVRWNGYSPASSSYYAIYRNCILSTSVSYSYSSSAPAPYLSKTNMIYYSLGIASFDMFQNYDSYGNNMFYKASNLSDVFKSWNGSFTDNENFELKDEAKTTYPDDDNKELGIYGGNLPFTPNPTNPKITKFNVASKSTADGKLSVDIEVKAAE